jgi:hypothetical protein
MSKQRNQSARSRRGSTGVDSQKDTEKQSEITDTMKAFGRTETEDARYCWAFFNTYAENLHIFMPNRNKANKLKDFSP